MDDSQRLCRWRSPSKERERVVHTACFAPTAGTHRLCTVSDHASAADSNPPQQRPDAGPESARAARPSDRGPPEPARASQTVGTGQRHCPACRRRCLDRRRHRRRHRPTKRRCHRQGIGHRRRDRRPPRRPLGRRSPSHRRLSPRQYTQATRPPPPTIATCRPAGPRRHRAGSRRHRDKS